MKKTGLCLIAIMTLCVGSAIAGQATTPPQQAAKTPELVTHVLDIKFISPDEFRSVLLPFSETAGARINPNPRLKTLTLTGTPEVLAVMEAIVRKLDVAPPPDISVEITAHILVTSDEPASSPEMPAQLDPVLKQLRSTFNYKHYQLLDTFVLRNRIGDAGRTFEEIPVPGVGDKKLDCGFSYSMSQLVHDERGNIVKLSGLQLSLGKGLIMTSIDLRAGQMVVVGKTNFAVGNNALIAVFSARIVD